MNDSLKCKVVNSQLVITIGIEDLAYAVQNSPDWDDTQFSIQDKVSFGEAMNQELLFGTPDDNLIYRMLDKAALNCLENGDI